MNVLIIAAAVTNVLFHPYWEKGNYTSNIVAKNDWPMSRTNDVHWFRAHTTTNAPSFHITAVAQHGWTSFLWKSDLNDAKWEQINCNHKQYRSPVFKVYMHPDSLITQKMLASNCGYFKMGTHWNYEILEVDMQGFWPKPFQSPRSLYSLSTRSEEPPPVPGD